MVHHRPSALTVALTTNTGSGNRLSFYAAGLHGLVDAVLGRVLGGSGDGLFQSRCGSSGLRRSEYAIRSTPETPLGPAIAPVTKQTLI
jgi:hypothetical protein